MTTTTQNSAAMAELDRARAQLASALAAYAFAAGLDAAPGARRLAFARQAAMYLAYVTFGMSLKRVASAFDRDRSTASHACHRMEEARDDPSLDERLEALEDLLRSAPEPGAAA